MGPVRRQGLVFADDLRGDGLHPVRQRKQEGNQVPPAPRAGDE